MIQANDNNDDEVDDEHVDAHHACPNCGETEIDNLAWLDDENVKCLTCGTVYQP